MASTCCKITWLKYLLADLQVSSSQPTALYCDNQAAIHIASNPIFHEHTKHIELDRHLIRDHTQAGSIQPFHVSTHSQVADVFTKALSSSSFFSHLFKLGIENLYSPVCEGLLHNMNSAKSSACKNDRDEGTRRSC